MSEVYEDLSILIKQMPDKRRMTGVIIKNNLIDPYSNTLKKEDEIHKKLNSKINE